MTGGAAPPCVQDICESFRMPLRRRPLVTHVTEGDKQAHRSMQGALPKRIEGLLRWRESLETVPYGRGGEPPQTLRKASQRRSPRRKCLEPKRLQIVHTHTHKYRRPSRRRSHTDVHVHAKHCTTSAASLAVLRGCKARATQAVNQREPQALLRQDAQVRGTTS